MCNLFQSKIYGRRSVGICLVLSSWCSLSKSFDLLVLVSERSRSNGTIVQLFPWCSSLLSKSSSGRGLSCESRQNVSEKTGSVGFLQMVIQGVKK
jgi:hypothetical protein